MIVRRSTSCWTHTCRTWASKRCPTWRGHHRLYSSATATSVLPSQSPSSIAPLACLKDELDKLSPRFDVRASQIQILQSPGEFYETLKSKILKAKRRIYLTTLYIGKSEHELVSTVRQALLNNPSLKVSFLTDALRGTRETPEPSCASLLVALVAEFGSDRVEVRMYHTPNLTGLRKRLIPKRINEGWGLQHMKLYGFDDEVIISGANLSTDYFMNRQDRYHVIASREITDYFESIHKTVSNLSYLVQPGHDSSGTYQLHWPEANPAPSPLDDPTRFITCANTVLKPLIRPSSTSQRQLSGPGQDTAIYPLAQLTPLLRPDTSTEYPGLITILRHLSTTYNKSRWMFTAGYFNVSPELKTLLLESKCQHGIVVTASPFANGFYGSRGVSGMLPAAYTLLARRFLESVRRTEGGGQNIELKEWRRGGYPSEDKNTDDKEGRWTYHAKGLWITLPGQEHPSITLVGSSNYTKRSYSLDLEMNLLVLTTNEDLKRRLAEEQAWLQEYAKKIKIEDLMTTERRVGLHVRVAMWIVSLVGGAL